MGQKSPVDANLSQAGIEQFFLKARPMEEDKMLQYGIKVAITAILVICISEAAKRWTLLGAIIASLPLTSILAMIWLYADTKSVQKVSELSWGIFWAVIPSLLFFILFPVLTKFGWKFWPSLSVSVFGTALGYWIYIQVLSRLGVKI